MADSASLLVPSRSRLWLSSDEASIQMRGVSVDCTNRPPTWRSVRLARLDAVRLEMRDLPEFYQYTEQLTQGRRLKQVWLVGPSTGPVQPILDKTTVKPELVIIGNEPDLVGESSWTMTQQEYINLWNETSLLVKHKWPDIELSLAGIHSYVYLRQILPSLQVQPNYYNLHYPEGINHLKEFAGNHPVIIGEWCWKNATQQEMHDWVVHFLNYYTWHWFWFCWADYMVPGMGLMNHYGKSTTAYHRLKQVLRSTN